MCLWLIDCRMLCVPRPLWYDNVTFRCGLFGPLGKSFIWFGLPQRVMSSLSDWAPLRRSQWSSKTSIWTIRRAFLEHWPPHLHQVILCAWLHCRAFCSWLSHAANYSDVTSTLPSSWPQPKTAPLRLLIGPLFTLIYPYHLCSVSFASDTWGFRDMRLFICAWPPNLGLLWWVSTEEARARSRGRSAWCLWSAMGNSQGYDALVTQECGDCMGHWVFPPMWTHRSCHERVRRRWRTRKVCIPIKFR